jgi:mRNA interferase YafQ
VRQLQQTAAFRSDLRRLKKRGHKFEELEQALLYILNNESLPSKYFDHALSGNWKDHREFHIRPDWLLIYRIEAATVILVRSGSHSDLY